MASLKIKVVWDLDPLITYFSEKAVRQIPFATAVALNDVAFKSRKALVEDLEKRYVKRNTWTVRGMRVVKARKTKLFADVGSLRPYMKLHVEGGERTSQHSHQAVPLAVRTPETKPLGAKSKWPGTMLRRKTSQQVPLGKGRFLVLTRRSKKAEPVAQWLLVPRVRIKPTWPLGKIVEVTVSRHWEAAMARAWEWAMKPPPKLRRR